MKSSAAIFPSFTRRRTIVQEALTNVARHAGASEVLIELSNDGNACTVRISDNGVGASLDAQRKHRSFGLLGMKERVRQLDGTCTFDSAEGRGFRISICLPVHSLASRNIGAITSIPAQARGTGSGSSGAQARDDRATIGHEIRNASTPVAAVASLLKTQYADDTRLAGHARMLFRQSELLAELASQLTWPLKAMQEAYAAIAGSQRTVKRLNVCELVEHSVEVAQANVPQHDPVWVRTPAGALWIEGDFGRLSQALVNLLINALRYSPPEGTVTITVARAGRHCYVSVKDNGIGIASDDLGRIFTRYMRSDDARLRAKSGLGVGLSVVKEIVIEHGGAIEAVSEGRDRGAEFIVRLPLARPF